MNERIDLRAILSASRTVVHEKAVVLPKKAAGSDRWKKTVERDERGRLVTKIGYKAQRDQYRMLRKMFAGCTAGADGSFGWYGDETLGVMGSCSAVRRFKTVVDGIYDDDDMNGLMFAEASGGKSDVLRALGRSMNVEVRIKQRGDYLEVVIPNARADDELVQLYVAVASLAGYAITRSVNGLLVANGEKEARWKPPVICPLIDAITLKGVKEVSYDVVLKTRPPVVQEVKHGKKAEEKEQNGANRVLGPHSFPRYMSTNWYYTDNEEVPGRMKNEDVLVTWEEYCRKQDIKQRYRVDKRTRKRKKRSKGSGNPNAPRFTRYSHSSVFKAVMRRLK
jgi:hypothetical protein